MAIPVGAKLESFELKTKEAIEAAERIGVKGLQMYSTSGEHAPVDDIILVANFLRKIERSAP